MPGAAKENKPREMPTRARRVSGDRKNMFRILGLSWWLTRFGKSSLRVRCGVLTAPNYATRLGIAGPQLGVVSAPIPANRGIHDSLVVNYAGSATSGAGRGI
jgi:hypothetical protein